jgi:Family of unknown function (DUF5871)
MIHAPEKYKDYYMSRVTRKNNKNFVVKVPDCKVLGIHTLANDNGYVIKMWVPPDSIASDTMADIDAMSMKAASDNNREWFTNGLSDEQINEYFRPCIDPSTNIADILVSSIKVPRSILWHGDSVDDFHNIATAPMREWKTMECSCTLEAQGLYFYKKKFGIRWIVREIAFHVINDLSQDDDHEATGQEERKDIEDFWENELQEVRSMVKADMDALYGRIDHLATFKKDLLDIFEAAKSEKTCNSSWDQQLDKLNRQIFCYKSGRL